MPETKLARRRRRSRSRRILRRYLLTGLTLPELRLLAFDVGVDDEAFAYPTKVETAEQVIASCRRHARLGCLIAEALDYADAPQLHALAVEQPPCVPAVKLQLTFPGAALTDPVADSELFGRRRERLRRALAAAAAPAAGNGRPGIALMGALSQPPRILVAVPPSAVASLLDLTVLGGHPVGAVLFESLPHSEQRFWERALCGETTVVHPPLARRPSPALDSVAPDAGAPGILVAPLRRGHLSRPLRALIVLGGLALFALLAVSWANVRTIWDCALHAVLTVLAVVLFARGIRRLTQSPEPARLPEPDLTPAPPTRLRR